MIIRHRDHVVRTVHQLWEEVMSQEYVSWIRSKFDWSVTTFNEIAWDAFHKAMTQFDGHQNSIRKYIHGWLPVAEMVQRYNKNEITTCPCCKGRERQDHVLRCPGAQSTAYQSEVFEELWRNMEKETDPGLLQMIKQHFRWWVQTPDYEAPVSRSAGFPAILRSQNKIGWTNFTRGRISIGFIKHQSQFYRSQEKANPESRAMEWGARLIKNLLETADKIWTYRCRQLHGEDTRYDPEEKCKAMERLWALYRRQHEASQHDSCLFTRPLEDWQQSSAKTITAWCVQVKKSLRKRQIVEANALLAKHRPIYEYFLQRDPPGAKANPGLTPGTGNSPNQTEPWEYGFCAYLYTYYMLHSYYLLFGSRSTNGWMPSTGT